MKQFQLMRILLIHQYFCPPGGSGNNRSFELARYFVLQGVSVTVITSPAYFPPELIQMKKKYLIHLDGLNIIVLNVSYSHYFSFFRKLISFFLFMRSAFAEAMCLDRHDCIYASSTPVSVWWTARKLSRRKRIPYFVEIVDLWPDIPVEMGLIRLKFFRNFLYKKQKLIFEDASLLISLSDGITRKIIEKNKSYCHKLITSYNGTNTQFFSPQSCNLSFKEKLGLKTDDKVVLYAGTMGIANGVGCLAEAAKFFNTGNIPGVYFLLVGEGNREHEIREKSRIEGIGNIIFHSTVPKENIRDFFSIADVGVVTFSPFSLLETNSANKFYDYLAAGLPVCINYRGWQAEYLEKYNCGLSAPQGRTDLFCKNIERLISDASLRKKMSKNARCLALEKFDREEIARKLLDRIVLSIQHGIP